MPDYVFFNNYINTGTEVKVALRVLGEAANSDNLYVRIQGNTNRFAFRYNTNSQNTFNGCVNLVGSIYNLTAMPTFNVDNISNMDGMFENCSSLYGQPVIGLNILSARNAFRNSGITDFPQNYYIELGNGIQNIPRVLNKLQYADNMFRDCHNLIGNTNNCHFLNARVNLISISHLCENCYNMYSSPLNILQSGNCLCIDTVDASYVYANCHNLQYGGDVPYYGNTIALNQGVANYAFAFYGCYRKTSTGLYPWANATHLNFVTNTWALANARDLTSMYENCLNLQGRSYIDGGPEPVVFANMYRNCKNLTSTPIICRGRIPNAFRDCSNLRGAPFIPPKSISTTSFCYTNPVTYASGVAYANLCGTFYGCTNLEGVAIKGYNTIFDNETFGGINNFKIWVNNLFDFYNLYQGAAGFSSDNVYNTYGSDQVLTMNTVYGSNSYEYNLNYKTEFTNNLRNITVYCSETAAPTAPVQLKQFTVKQVLLNGLNTAQQANIDYYMDAIRSLDFGN